MTSDVDIVHTKFEVPSKVYNFIVDNFFYLRIFLETQIFILSSVVLNFVLFLNFSNNFRC